MSEERGVLLQLPGTVSDYFLLEYQCGHLATARLYKAFDRTNRISVGLWVTRESLTPSEAAVFSRKLEDFRGKVSGSEIRSFGVDTHGVGFVSLANLDGVKITIEPADVREKERRFLMCLRAVARIHEAGLVVGTISSESFFMNRNGTVRFIGLPPMVHSRGELTEAELVEYAAYRREETTDIAPTASDDVYALLVLGYRMFAGVHPQIDDGVLAPVYSFNPARPSWVDELITPLLTADRSSLPISAGVFLERLRIFKDHQLSAQLAPVVVENEKSPQREQRDGLRQVKLSAAMGVASDVGSFDRLWKRFNLRSRSALVVIGVCVLLALFVGRAVLRAVKAHASRQMVLDAGPADVALDFGSAAGWEERQEQLRKVIASDDPLASDVLLRMLRSVEGTSERDFIFQGILSRSQRMGLPLSAEQVGIWKRKLQGPIPLGALLERLLRIVDPLVPAEARVQMLSELYVEQPALAVRLAMAAALDLGASEPYRGIVARGSKENAGIKGGEKRSLFALGLVIPDIASTFLDAIRPQIARIPDEDLIWVVTQLAVSNPQLGHELGAALIKRQLVTGPRALYLRELDPLVAIPSAVRVSLVNCAVFGPTRKDLTALGGWNSNAAGRALLLVALTTDDAQLVATAFDIMAAKPSPEPSVTPVISAVRGANEVNKAQAARLVAAVVLDARLSDDEISKALAGIELSEEWNEVVRALLDAHADRVVTELLHQHSSSLDTELLFDMLERGRPKVKIAAIEVLGQSKDVGIRKRALELYPEEKEPDVIAAYERHLKDK